MDASASLDPMRRLLGAVVHDFREPLVGIQVVAERLSRLPKPTRERCVEDMDRILELTQRMDRLIDDLGAFVRRSAGGSGARLSLRSGDLGALVKAACEKLPSGAGRVQVKAAEVQGLWDEEALQRIVTALVLSARQNEGGNVFVEVAPSRDGAVVSVRDEGAAPGSRRWSSSSSRGGAAAPRPPSGGAAAWASPSTSPASWCTPTAAESPASGPTRADSSCASRSQSWGAGARRARGGEGSHRGPARGGPGLHFGVGGTTTWLIDPTFPPAG